MEHYIREYTLSEELKTKLTDRMKTATGVNSIAEHDFRALVVTDDKGVKFTSIIFNSKYTNLDSLVHLYNMIFKTDNGNFIRTRNYLKMRKWFHLETDETILTISSYLQASGITDELELLNKLLRMIEAGAEY